MNPVREVQIQPVVSWPRDVRAGSAHVISVDLRMGDPAAAWPYDEEEFLVGCMIDGRPWCVVRALGDAGVVLHRFGGTYGPAYFSAEFAELPDDLTGAALWLTLTTAGGVPFYTAELPLDASAVAAATEIPGVRVDTGDRRRAGTGPGTAHLPAGSPRPGRPVPFDEVDIGSAPAPGVTLRRILAGRAGSISRLAWAPDGVVLVSGSLDGTVRTWDTRNGETTPAIAMGFPVRVLAWQPGGAMIAVGGGSTGIAFRWPHLRGPAGPPSGGPPHPRAAAWSPDGQQMIIGGPDRAYWWRPLAGDAPEPEEVGPLPGPFEDVAWSPGGRSVAVPSGDGFVIMLSAETRSRVGVGLLHPARVLSLAFSPAGGILACGVQDGTIVIWEYRRAGEVARLAGHTAGVVSVAFNTDGSLLASKSRDGSVRLWRCDTWAAVAELPEPVGAEPGGAIAFHPRDPGVLATLGRGDTAVRIWDVDVLRLLGGGPADGSVRIKTARVVLVGDPGVGKTNLGAALSSGAFRGSPSIDGPQSWTFDSPAHPQSDVVRHEVSVVDLPEAPPDDPARAVHPRAHAVLVVFDPVRDSGGLEGVAYWLRQLRDKGGPPPAVLVVSRADRGRSSLTDEELTRFCREHGVRGGFVVTSVSTGQGISELRDVLDGLIPWNSLPAHESSAFVERLADAALRLQYRWQPGDRLITLADVQRDQSDLLPVQAFDQDTLRSAAARLEAGGYVEALPSADDTVLVPRHLLFRLASAIVGEAKRHSRGLGAVDESALPAIAGYVPQLHGVHRDDRRILIDTVVGRLLERDVCFRERVRRESLLVFPRLITPPAARSPAAVDYQHYLVRGDTGNLAAAMVVRVGQAGVDPRGDGAVCGFRVTFEDGDVVELTLHHEPAATPADRQSFARLFIGLLHEREVQVTAFSEVVCERGHPQNHDLIRQHVVAGRPSLHCIRCGSRVEVPLDQQRWPRPRTEASKARLRSLYQDGLGEVRVVRPAGPRCDLMYPVADAAWGGALAEELRAAGVRVLDAGAVPDHDAALVLVKSVPGGPPRRAVELHRPGRPVMSIGFDDDADFLVRLFDLVVGLYSLEQRLEPFASVRLALAQELSELRALDRPQIFVSYSSRDEGARRALAEHLAAVEGEGVLRISSNETMAPGVLWRQELSRGLAECDAAVLLLSADFLESPHLMNEELPALLRLREETGLPVLPVVVRPCRWYEHPGLRDTQVLPRDGRPLLEQADPAARWAEVAAAVVAAVREEPGSAADEFSELSLEEQLEQTIPGLCEGFSGEEVGAGRFQFGGIGLDGHWAQNVTIHEAVSLPQTIVPHEVESYAGDTEVGTVDVEVTVTFEGYVSGRDVDGHSVEILEHDPAEDLYLVRFSAATPWTLRWDYTLLPHEELTLDFFGVMELPADPEEWA
jgi:hypothetical protein